MSTTRELVSAVLEGASAVGDGLADGSMTEDEVLAALGTLATTITNGLAGGESDAKRAGLPVGKRADDIIWPRDLSESVRAKRAKRGY